MIKIRKTEIRPRVFLLEFTSRYDLASTFLRFQEHYESRQFRSKVFSLEEYMDWYAHEFGKFTYFEDWSGFNIPSSALQPFYEGRFDPLLEKEKQLLKLFSGLTTDFYLIGMVRNAGDTATLKHELAHALFHTEPEYRKAARACMREYDTKGLRQKLLSIGYCRQVLGDEVQAYVLTERDFLPRRDGKRLAPLKRQLDRLFKKFSQ